MRLTGYTVLVVEDDVDNLELLTSHFEDEGAIVIGAGSMTAALNATLAHDVDALVSDLELPDGDGCTLLRQLRRRTDATSLPAIALTGYSDEVRRRRATDCGFNRFAVKPFSLDALTELLGELIDRENGSAGQSCHAVTDRAARGLRGR